jgi:hypothetical protein
MTTNEEAIDPGAQPFMYLSARTDKPEAAGKASRVREGLPPLMPRGALGGLWWEGLRTLLMMRPQWRHLQATPAVVAALVLVATACAVLAERLFMQDGAVFYWPSLLGGWFPTAAAAWACWLLASRRRHPQMPGPLASDSTQLGEPREPGEDKPSAMTLFALICAQSLPYTLIAVLCLGPMLRSEDFALSLVGRWVAWGTWIGLLLWLCLAQVTLLWRSGAEGVWPRLFAALVLIGSFGVQMRFDPPRHWYPASAEEAAHDEQASPKPLQFKQEDIEVQPLLLQQQLQALQTPRRGVPGMYAITFAPYAEVDVFKRESALVASLMQERFGAAGRTIQLVNHPDTLRQRPWATPLNLQRTIRHMARMMKRDEDVLFIHLTSHGASNGELAAEFKPLAVDPVTPGQLKRWLDEAGVRWRVISISACYSGSWIPALADDNTLVMTAADADHTSYGCGKRSELTFFGRAMYDEQLRQVRSFEEAHAAAREVILRREKEAGKTDGYSNPQIRMGGAIRERLKLFERSLAR